MTGLVTAASDGAFGHLVGDVVGLADRERDDRQGRVGGGTGAELAAVRDEQVLNLVGLAPLVADPVLRPFAHAATAHVVARREWRRLVPPFGAERAAAGTALSERAGGEP